MISREPFQWNGPQASEPVCDEKEYDELDSLFSKNTLLRGDLEVNASFSMINIWKKKTKNKASFKPVKLQFPKQGNFTPVSVKERFCSSTTLQAN